jgi:flagellar M-ring protein FliF
LPPRLLGGTTGRALIEGRDVNAFLQTLKNLGPVRLAAIGFVGLVIIAFFVFAIVRMTAPKMMMLYGELADKDAAAVTEQLDSQLVTYELRNNGTEIWVDEAQVDKIRIDLAREGLPKRGNVGNEIFDAGEGFGTTSFIQNINRQRALEGELARTVASIEGVRQARVHLVLPKRELFSRSEQVPSASIFLQLQQGTELSRQNIAAIRNLVAAAVPQLRPNGISVVDDRGQLLASPEDDTSSALTATTEELRVQQERRLSRQVEDLLSRTIGFGKVRAEVSVDMDFDRLTVNSEAFDPDSKVERSTQAIKEETENTEAEAIDSITVANQLPSSDANNVNPLFPTSRNRSNRTENTVNYEISKTVTNQVRQTGIVRRLSVAVMVDGLYPPAADGAPTYTARTPEEIEQIRRLVQSAVGYNPDRGDSIEVVNMRFVDQFGTGVEEPTILGMKRDDLFRIAEIITFGIVAILVILLVIRPLLARAFEDEQDEELEQLEDDTDVMPQLPAGEGALAQALAMEGGSDDDDEMDSMIDVNRIEGKVRASTLRKIGEIVEKHPEEAVAILRAWMYQES